MTYRLDHVTILISSFETSGAYYETLLPLLGFEQTNRGIWHDGKGFYFQFREAEPGTRPYERYGAGMNHLGFGVEAVDDVLRVRDGMAAAGFEVPEIQNLHGATALFMRDPDGIRFEVTHYPPGASPVA